MLKKVILLFAVLSGSASAQSVTPNIGLQLPSYNSSNWGTQLNYDLTRLDGYLSGGYTIPNLSISTLTTPTVNATVNGYQINGTAPLNHFLIGNGTYYVDTAQIPAGSLPSSYTNFKLFGTPPFIGFAATAGGSNYAGLTSPSTGVFDFGNGTAGNSSGTLNAATLTATTSVTTPSVNNFVYIRPSGDTTGATDNAAIQAAVTAGDSIWLQAGNYYLTGITAANPFRMECAGSGLTFLNSVAATTTFFTVSYGGGQLNNESNGAGIYNCGFQPKSGVVPTGGDVLNIAGVSSTAYLSGFHFAGNQAWGLAGGIRTGSFLITNWFTNNMFTSFVTGGDGCIFYNTPPPGGDARFDGNQCNRAGNVTIAQSDVTEFANQKTNLGGVLFTQAGPTGHVSFLNISDESAASCGFDFGTGSNPPTGISIQGGQIDLTPTALCNTANAPGLAYSYQEHATTAYPSNTDTLVTGESYAAPAATTGTYDSVQSADTTRLSTPVNHGGYGMYGPWNLSGSNLSGGTATSQWSLGFALPGNTSSIGTNIVLGCLSGVGAWSPCLTFNPSTQAATFGAGGLATPTVAATTSVTTPIVKGNDAATFAAGSGAGTSPSAPACFTGYTCTASSGTVSITTGTSPNNTGALITVSFTALPAAYANCVVSGFGVPAGATVLPYIGGTNATSFSIWTGNTPAASTPYEFSYVCQQ